MNRFENFKAGLIKDNPVFSLFLGICSTLAITTSVNNAIGMGVTRKALESPKFAKVESCSDSACATENAINAMARKTTIRFISDASVRGISKI